jgi:hypothetical protein
VFQVHVTVLPDGTLRFAGVTELFATVTSVGPVGTTGGGVGVVLVGEPLPLHAVRQTNPKQIAAARPRGLPAIGQGVERVVVKMQASRRGSRWVMVRRTSSPVTGRCTRA